MNMMAAFKETLAILLVLAIGATGYSEERAFTEFAVPAESNDGMAMVTRSSGVLTTALFERIVPRNLKGNGSKSSKGNKTKGPKSSKKAKDSKGPKKAKKTKSPRRSSVMAGLSTGKNPSMMAMAEPARVMAMMTATKAMTAMRKRKNMRALESFIGQDLSVLAIADLSDGLPVRDLKGSGSKSSKGSKTKGPKSSKKAKKSKGPKSSKKAKKTKSPRRSSMMTEMTSGMGTRMKSGMAMTESVGTMAMTARKAMDTMRKRKGRTLESDLEFHFPNDIFFVENDKESPVGLTEAGMPASSEEDSGLGVSA